MLKQIQHRRIELGYSQFYLARKLGLKTAKSYGNIESGKTELTIQRLFKIADLLEMQAMIKVTPQKINNTYPLVQQEIEIRLNELIKEIQIVLTDMQRDLKPE